MQPLVYQKTDKTEYLYQHNESVWSISGEMIAFDPDHDCSIENADTISDLKSNTYINIWKYQDGITKWVQVKTEDVHFCLDCGQNPTLFPIANTESSDPSTFEILLICGITAIISCIFAVFVYCCLHKKKKKTKRRIDGNARGVQANESEQSMDIENEESQLITMQPKSTLNDIDEYDVQTKNEKDVTHELEFESSSGYEEEMEFERPFAESSSGYEPYDSNKPVPLHPKFQQSIRQSMKKQRAEFESVKPSFETMSARESYFQEK